MSVFDDIKDISSQDRKGRYSKEELLSFYRYIFFSKKDFCQHFVLTHYSPYLRPPSILDLSLEKITSRFPLAPASHSNDAPRESLYSDSNPEVKSLQPFYERNFYFETCYIFILLLITRRLFTNRL